MFVTKSPFVCCPDPTTCAAGGRGKAPPESPPKPAQKAAGLPRQPSGTLPKGFGAPLAEKSPSQTRACGSARQPPRGKAAAEPGGAERGSAAGPGRAGCSPPILPLRRLLGPRGALPPPHHGAEAIRPAAGGGFMLLDAAAAASPPLCVCVSLGLGLAEATEISSSPSAPTPARAPAPLRRSPRGSPGPGCRRCEPHRAAGRAPVTGGPGGPARAGRRPGSPPPAAPGWLRQQLPAAFFCLFFFFKSARPPLLFFFFNGKGDKLYRRPLRLFSPLASTGTAQLPAMLRPLGQAKKF